MKQSGNGVLLRRHGSNIGDEDNLDLLQDISDDEKEGTLMNRKNNLFHRSSSRVNGTSEVKTKSSQGQSSESPGGNNKDSSNSSFRVQKFLEKGKASLSRSKSELGEQHKKMISHLSKSRNEITEQNKKLLANLSTRKFNLSTSGSSNGKASSNGSSKSPPSSNYEPEEPMGKPYQPVTNGREEKKSESRQNGHSTSSKLHPDLEADLSKDLDGFMKNFGIDVSMSNSSSVSKQNNYNGSSRSQSSMSQSMYATQPLESSTTNNHFHDLERHLENDYGEFEYIDEAGTLTRTLKTNGESVNCDEHRKSMFSFSDEVFDELEKTGTLKLNVEASTPLKSNKSPTTSLSKNNHEDLSSTTDVYDTQHQQHQQQPSTDIYETYGAWRQRKYSGSNNSGYVSQYYSYNNNNTHASATSSKLSALIADQTLLLRHHKRRKQKRSSQQDVASITDHEQRLQSLYELEQQLTKTKEQLANHQGSSSFQTPFDMNNGAPPAPPPYSLHVTTHPLRRCSSLSQTAYDETADDLNDLIEATIAPPPQKINGTSPAMTTNNSPSPWLSTTSSTNPCSTSTNPSCSNARYLYRGKFQPSSNNSSNSSGSNNNNSYKNKSPWQLRSNLSSFARRRRGSSTSLHNFSDDEDANGSFHDSNGINAAKHSDSISLADSAEVMSMNHR